MAEQSTIVADPISSDGSEDSWILLDEMDEEMNEINGIVNESPVEVASAATVPKISIETAEVATETYQPSQIDDIFDNDFDDFESKMEIMSNDLIDTHPSDDSSDSEQMYSSRPYDRVSLSPTNDDGSTTDGSISMIGDTEFHRYKTKPKRKLSKDGKNQLNMLMHCRPIDMTVKQPRSTVQISGRCAMPIKNSIEGLATVKPCIIDELFNFLERLDNFFANTPMISVFLLIVAIASLTFYCNMCIQYKDIKFAFADLNQKYFELQVQSMETDGKLARCEFFYEQELKNKINKPIVPDSSATEKDEKINAINLETKLFQRNDYIVPDDTHVIEDIHPTKPSGQFKTEATIDKTEIPYMVPTVLSLYRRFSSESESLPETLSDFKSYGDVDDKIDFLDSAFLANILKSEKINCDADTEAAIDYERTERGYICENDAMSDFAQKYIQDEDIHHTKTKPHKSMDKESKSRKEEKKIDKTKTKVKHHEHEKAQRKENERDKKKYYDKKDRKESKGKKDKENRDTGKWNKVESKRAISNTFEYRHNDWVADSEFQFI